ncbi:MAG: transcription factor S [Nanoarchaeota archaeon]|nr:transcription factor S [Nanoarchaeota archaeon]
MQFCQKCGRLLVKKRTRFVCDKCGQAAKGKVKIRTSEKMAEKTKIGVLKDKESNVWPVTSATCPKCGNKTAYFWSAMARAQDEAETRFFRCTKCKNTWRESH